MRLVKRVRHDVQQSRGEGAEPALQQQEAHLRDRGPGKLHLDRGLGQHHEGSDERRGATITAMTSRAGVARRRTSAKAQHQEAARVDDAGVEECRDGRGRLHDLEQPAVQRQHRGFQHRRCDDQERGNRYGAGGRTPPLRARGSGKIRNLERAEAGVEEKRRDDETGIAQAADHELLGGARRAAGRSP